MGQGRAPDAAENGAGIGICLSSMQGLWVDLPDGCRGLVVATGFTNASGHEALIVMPRDGGPRRAIPWCGGYPEATVASGERRELAGRGEHHLHCPTGSFAVSIVTDPTWTPW